MSDAGRAVLAMRDVGKSFPSAGGPVDVLRGLNLTVTEGEFVAVTGPSGSGKSTFLHLAGLLDRPTRGSVRLDGVEAAVLEPTELCRLRKQRLGMIFQKYCLLPHRSVLDNVMFRFRYLDYSRADEERLARRALETVGIAHLADRPARLLSGGEMQRVAIARAVAVEPRLLLADEPTGNLDTTATRTIMECFRRLHDTGITIVMVTHNESLLEGCDRHLTFDGGTLC